MTETTIEKEQAKSWAQERTLMELLRETEGTNGILEKYLRAALSEEQIAAIKDQTDTVTKKLDEQGNELEAGLEELALRGSADSKQMSYAIDSMKRDMLTTLQGIGYSLSSADPKSLFGGLASGLGSMASGFKGLSGVLPIVVGGLSAMATIIGFVYSRSNEVNDGFLSLYKEGIRFSGGLGALNAAVGESGLTMAEFTGILNKHAASFQVLGGQRVVALNKTFRELTKNGSSLMMTQGESQDAMMDYVDIQRMSGTLQNMSTQQIATGGAKFLKSINDLSAASGRSREELLKGAKDAIAQPSYQAFISTLSQPMRDQLAVGVASLGTFGSDIQKQMQDMLISEATGGTAAMYQNNQAMFQLAQQTGNLPKLMNVLSIMKAGGDATAAMQDFTESVGASSYVTSGLMNTQAQFIPEVAAMRDQFGKLQLSAAQLADQERIAKEEGYKDLKDKQDKDEAASKRLMESNAKMATAMTGLNASFNDLALQAIPALTTVMDVLSGTIGVVNGVFNIFKGLITGVNSFFSETLGMGGIAGGAATAGVLGGGYMAARKYAGGSKFGIPGLQNLGMPNMSNIPGGEKAAEAMARMGKGFSGLGKGIGGVISSIMRGIAKGFAAFGSPKVLMGLVGIAGLAGSLWLAAKTFQEFANVNWEDMAKAGVAIVGLGAAAALAGLAAPVIAAGGIALGAAIAAIGSGVAAASWLMGETLPTLAEGIKKFGDIDGANLVQVGAGMAALGAGLAVMGAGTVVDAFAGLTAGIFNFFSGQDDPIDRLKRFGELSEPLSKSAKAMSTWSTSFKTAIDVLNTATLTANVEKTFAQIDKFLQLDAGGFFGGKPPIIDQIGGLAEVVGQLAEKAQNLQNATVAKPAATQSDQLQDKTMSYYTRQIQLTESILMQLQQQTTTLMTISTDTAIGNTDIIRALKESNKIY